ncbi:hypothetical protein INT45_002011 [Circinella minor]|uniref:Uncharacterized protein n=1 Tax=Circinella minor TaxID=1195481 RepID=A0A8H7SGP2_9FUNG|nr:hypothetical protein INT45_002011 [Circinella minor]
MQQQQRQFREVAFQWLQSIAHAFDSQQQQQHSSSSTSNSSTSNTNNNSEKYCTAQSLTDSANASLTQFEKTYVSFPEFISNDEASNNWTHHHHHHHHHHDNLQVGWPQSSRSTPSSMAC